MAQQASEEEANIWRRRLGAGANNRGWDLAEKTSRTPTEDAEMLHAARYLWDKIGTEKNFASANLLLGQVHALLGLTRTATEYAEQAFDYFTSRQSETLELALAHAVRANAAQASGKLDLHRESHAKALDIANTLTNPEDRKVFHATFDVIPKPAGAAR